MTREEAIKIVRENMHLSYDEGNIFKALQTLVPELRESEDERNIDTIFNCLYQCCDTGFISGTQRDNALVWLEKQKDHFRDNTKMVEQKSAENGVDVIRTSALLAADRLASAEMTGRLKERSEILENPEEYGLYKPASEEDDWKRKELIQYLEEKGDYRTVWMTWLKSLRPQPREEIYQAVKRDLAIRFMNYLDENRPEGKMCLSNGESEDIDRAFKENDWAKIMRYADKYMPHWKPSAEQMMALGDALEDMPEHYKPKCTLETLERDLKKLI